MLEFTTYIENRAPTGDPKLEVQIQIYGVWTRGSKGQRLVTPQLYSVEEIDFHINGIIERLEQVRCEAKAKLEENG